MVLAQVRSGGDFIIHALKGEGETRHHLANLGFLPGTKLTVVSRVGDNLIVNVRGSKIALDSNLAKWVLV